MEIRAHNAADRTDDERAGGAWARGRAGGLVAVVVAVTTLPVALSVTEPLTGRRGDLSALNRYFPTGPVTPAARVPSPVPSTEASLRAAEPARGPGLDPGRRLGAGSVDAVLRRATTGLPDGWEVKDVPETGANEVEPSTQIRPASCERLLTRLAGADRARPRSADRKWSAGIRRDGMPFGVTNLLVTITSYRTPEAAARSRADNDEQLRVCPRWSVRDENTLDHRLRLRMETDPGPAAGDPSWRVLIHGDGRYRFRQRVESLLSVRVVGRNLVAVNVIQAGPREVDLGYQRRLRDEIMAATVRELGRRP